MAPPREGSSCPICLLCRGRENVDAALRERHPSRYVSTFCRLARISGMQAESIDARGRDVTDEPDRFGALFFAHAARLVRLAALLGDDDPEDVVQESFCKLYAARGRLRAEDAEVVSYLNKIVVNEVRGRQRRRQVARRDAHLLTTAETTDPTAVHGDRRAVVEALAGLPLRQREALVLRFWMDLPLAAIADAMGVRIGTVKSQISRGLDVVGAALREGVER